MKKTLVFSLALALVLSVTTAAFAFTAPTVGSFAYNMYNILVVNILQGAIGMVAGILCLCFGAYMIVQGKLFGAVPALLAGIIVFEAPNMATVFGLTL
jgi:hypothetical protein